MRRTRSISWVIVRRPIPRRSGEPFVVAFVNVDELKPLEPSLLAKVIAMP